MPTLLITGGAGFIGGHTAAMAIQNGWKVRLLDNLSTGLESKANRLERLGAEVIIGDVRDEETVKAAVIGCDAVVHLAAQVSVPRSMESPEETFEINVGGTSNLLHACEINGIARFVMASSAAVYGTNEAFPLDESHAGTFHSPYADSKWQNETQVLKAKTSGMNAIALRFFNVYGTGQRSDGAYAAVIPKFIDLAVGGQAPTIFGDGLQTRDFVHVDDVARALLMLATGPWTNDLEHVYNVCTQIEISLLDLLSSIHSVLRDIAPEIPLPPPKHVGERAGDIARSVGSKARLVNDTTWSPQVEFGQGIKQQILDCTKDA
jgi:nucleoside-diphosphate-sugar epimerase